MELNSESHQNGNLTQRRWKKLGQTAFSPLELPPEPNSVLLTRPTLTRSFCAP